MADAALGALMAVFIALLALAPFFLIAVAARYWIQRAPTDKGAKRRRNLVYVYILVALGVWEYYHTAILQTKLWRRLSGTCSIVLVNNSGVEVKDLDLMLRATGDPESQTNHSESMPRNSRRRIETRADEFKVENLTGVVGSNRFSFRGVAKKGERLVIGIESGGRIASRVE